MTDQHCIGCMETKNIETLNIRKAVETIYRCKKCGQTWMDRTIEEK